MHRKASRKTHSTNGVLHKTLCEHMNGLCPAGWLNEQSITKHWFQSVRTCPYSWATGRKTSLFCCVGSRHIKAAPDICETNAAVPMSTPNFDSDCDQHFNNTATFLIVVDTLVVHNSPQDG